MELTPEDFEMTLPERKLSVSFVVLGIVKESLGSSRFREVIDLDIA
jgi:hypothetical protein